MKQAGQLLLHQLQQRWQLVQQELQELQARAADICKEQK
jgi:hypothetical protein